MNLYVNVRFNDPDDDDDWWNDSWDNDTVAIED